jgi:hypothetical protein
LLLLSDFEENFFSAGSLYVKNALGGREKDDCHQKKNPLYSILSLEIRGLTMPSFSMKQK